MSHTKEMKKTSHATDALQRWLAALFLSIGVLLTGAAPAAAAGPINTTLFGTAIEGYDPVAYFTQGRPVKGSRQYTFEWQGATWRFASAQHRDLFAADPHPYAPQYGGYCAYAVANGSTASIDPEAWRIVDGKLYLNLSKSVQRIWEQDIPGYIANANRNWPSIRADLVG